MSGVGDAAETNGVTGRLYAKRRQIALGIVGLVALLAVPDVARFTQLSFATIHRGILFGLAALGLNLLLRHTELVSFGHAAFFGCGAYAAAVLVSHYEVSSGTVLILAGLLAGAGLALLIGYLVAKYVDIYFALLTLAFNQVLYGYAVQSGFLNRTDGLSVRAGTDRPTLLGLELEPDPYNILLYYLTVAILLVSLVVMWKLVNSPFGRALDAIGQDRTRARFVGIPVERYVWIAFTISGAYGGLAGALYALVQPLHVSPGNVLYVFISGEILFMAILGGVGTLVGPILGGVVLVYLLEMAVFYTEYFNALTGIVLLIVVFVLPEGILGSLPNIADGVARRGRNPGLVREDAGSISTALRRRAHNAATTVRILLFGVK